MSPYLAPSQCFDYEAMSNVLVKDVAENMEDLVHSRQTAVRIFFLLFREVEGGREKLAFTRVQLYLTAVAIEFDRYAVRFGFSSPYLCVCVFSVQFIQTFIAISSYRWLTLFLKNH